MDSPLQSFPPFAGAGFLQSRKRFCEPSSHVFEQGVHMDQVDQLPLTNKKKEENMTPLIMRIFHSFIYSLTNWFVLSVRQSVGQLE